MVSKHLWWMSDDEALVMQAVAEAIFLMSQSVLVKNEHLTLFHCN